VGGDATLARGRWDCGLIFLLFVLMTVLALMNIITGIFVNEAIETAKQDQELMVAATMEHSRDYLLKLKTLFGEMDANENGKIAKDDFERHMKRNSVKMLFSMLGIDVSDPVSFFRLLDVDGSHELEIDEFVMGCMRFKGASSMVNIECSILETKQLVAKLVSRTKRAEENLQLVQETLSNVLAHVAGDELKEHVSIPPSSRSLTSGGTEFPVGP